MIGLRRGDNALGAREGYTRLEGAKLGYGNRFDEPFMIELAHQR